MPSFGFKGPKVEGPDVDVKLPKAEIDVDAPKLDIKGPEIDIESPSGKIKGPKFNLPSISGPKISMPDIDFNLKGPKIKGDMDLSAPKVEGDIKMPDVDIKGPEIDVEGPKGGFEMPKFKMPKFGFKGPKVEGPDVDVKLPKAEIDVNAPKLDIKGTEIDIESPSGKIKGPKFNLPSISGPKISKPDFDANLKGPKIKGDMDLSATNLEADIMIPDVDIKSAEIDVEAPKGGFEMPKFKLPKFGFKSPKFEGPEVDVKLPKGEIDMDAPKLDIKGPQVDIESSSGKIKGPKVNLPSISGPKISVPDVDINLKGPKIKGDMDFSAPKLEADIKVPDVDIKGPEVVVEGPKGGFEMPKIKIPKLKGPKVEGPDVEVKLPEAEIDVDAPKLDIKGPEIDIESPSGKIKGPKFNLPSISGPKISMPDVDFNLKGPKIKGDMDLSAPKLEGDIKIPDVDIKGPEFDVEGPKGGFEMPKIKMPSFGFKGPKVEGPDVDVKLPKAEIDVDAPKLDIKGAEIDIESPRGKIRGPKLNLPSISGPKISMPDVDLNLKAPKVKGEMDLTAPKVEGDIKVPYVDIRSSEIEVEGGKGGFEIPKMKMPTFVIKGPIVEGSDIDVNLPKAEFDMNAPNLDIKGPKIDIESHSGKIIGPQFNLPSTSGPKTSSPEFDVTLRGPKLEGDLDVHGKTGKFKVPKNKGKSKKIDLSVDSGSPNINMKGTKKNVFGKLHFPDVELDIKSPKAKGDWSLSEGKTDADLACAAKVSLQDPEVDRPSGMHYPEGKISFPQIKAPKFAIALPQAEGFEATGNIESETSSGMSLKTKSSSLKYEASPGNVDMSGPDFKQGERKVKVKIPKLFGKSKAKSGSAGNLKGPEIEISPRQKETGVDVEGQMGTMSMSPKEKSASLDFFRKSRHSPSEGAGTVSSASTLEAGGGDISLNFGEAKGKEKKGKLKFGTFGGFGSKSKGSYEVTFGEDSEASAEGTTVVSSSSKKTRLSSSSSNESGSKGGFRFPKVELSVSPKTE